MKASSAELAIWMHRCVELARKAKARGESPVGALIMRNGAVIAEGIEAAKGVVDITRHAEVIAINQARWALGTAGLSDCILVTTNEPCILCSYAIRHHRIPMVVFGVGTGEIGGYSSDLAVLKDRTVKRWGEPPEVVAGMLEADCRAM